MSRFDWNVPRTEEGVQTVLTRLAECRAEDNLVEVGNGLLALAFLVKWVGSDTNVPPFERSHQLAVEALNAFRAARDEKGQVRALIDASVMVSHETRDQMLTEAETLAHNVGDADLITGVMVARARTLATRDRDAAHALYLQILERYRRTQNQHGIAQTLFGLAISSDDTKQSLIYTVEAASIFRSLSD